jgi:hypothetical protein
MPVDLMLIAAGVVVMFVALAAVWDDLRRRPRQLAQQPSVKRRAF